MRRSLDDQESPPALPLRVGEEIEEQEVLWLLHRDSLLCRCSCHVNVMIGSSGEGLIPFVYLVFL